MFLNKSHAPRRDREKGVLGSTTGTGIVSLRTSICPYVLTPSLFSHGGSKVKTDLPNRTSVGDWILTKLAADTTEADLFGMPSGVVEWIGRVQGTDISL